MTGLARRAMRHGAVRLAGVLNAASEVLAGAADPRSAALTLALVAAELEARIAAAELAASSCRRISSPDINAVAAAEAMRGLLYWIEARR